MSVIFKLFFLYNKTGRQYLDFITILYFKTLCILRKKEKEKIPILGLRYRGDFNLRETNVVNNEMLVTLLQSY